MLDLVVEGKIDLVGYWRLIKLGGDFAEHIQVETMADQGEVNV